MSKLPPSHIDPAAFANPYSELQNILLWSSSFSIAQKTARSLGSNRTSVLMDQ
jgi:hypothetical protein